MLENPVTLPGHPLWHIARINDATHAEINREFDTGEFDTGEFDGYGMLGIR